jgi:ABC-2 type transport system permease protein
VESINAQPEMQTIKVSTSGNTVETGQSFIVPLLLLLTLYMTILGYSSTVAWGAREEKNSRMIEVLITTVEPYQIMVSKLLGIGLVGLTQYLVWGTLVFPLKAVITGSGVSLPRIPLSLLVYCLIFFILGYFLFATLNLIVGAIAAKDEDAALISRPLGLINMLPLLIYLLVVKDPHSGLSIALSMIPFLSPTMMLTRIAVSPTPWWHILLSMLILLASIFCALWIASKVYRARILIYGKRITIRELTKSFRQA